MRLAVKQYTPKCATVEDGATLILAHGIDVSKECFEPLIDDLLRRFRHIHSVWAIDAASNAASYELNRNVIGDEPHWLDYPRDIWQVINHFQELMPQPLFGVGQSLGCGALSLLSTWHPRLFAGLIFCEPAFGPDKGIEWPTPPKYYPGVLVAKRQDVWSSREQARNALRRSQMYKHYDPRVFERVMQYEIRAVTEMDSRTDASKDAVTLVTPKSLVTAQWLRPEPPLPGRTRGEMNRAIGSKPCCTAPVSLGNAMRSCGGFDCATLVA
jgi:pimeloyl-ACP methyl ester carboxylesterase